MVSSGRKQRFLLIFVISLSLLCIVLVAASAIAINRVSSIVAEVRDSNARLTDQLRNNREELSILSRNMALMADDSNDVRFQMGLEPREYTYTTPDNPAEGGGNDVVALFEAAKTILRNYEEQNELIEFEELLQQADLQKFLEDNDLVLESVDRFSVGLIRNSDRYFNMVYYPAEKQVEVSASYPQTQITEAWGSRLMAKIRQLIPERELYFRYIRGKSKELVGLENHSKITALLTEKRIHLSPLREDSISFKRSVVSDGKIVADICLLKDDNRFTVAGVSAADRDELIGLLIQRLEEILG